MLRIEDIERKLARRPFSPLFARLASEYFVAGRVEEAKELCLSGLEKYPSYPVAHIVLAKCYAAEKDYSHALGHLRRSVTALPDAKLITEMETEWEQLHSLIGKEDSVQPEFHPATAETITEAEVHGEYTATPVISFTEIPTPPAVPSISEVPTTSREKFLIEDGRIISKTLAEIYAMQGEYGEAIITYRMLRQQRPQMQEECDLRISELEQALQAKLNHQKSVVTK